MLVYCIHRWSSCEFKDASVAFTTIAKTEEKGVWSFWTVMELSEELGEEEREVAQATDMSYSPAEELYKRCMTFYYWHLSPVP